MGPTAGNTPVGSAYFYLSLVGELFTSWIGEKMILYLLTALWYRWHLTWDFYLYKVCIPTPSLFVFAIFSSMSVLVYSKFRRIFCAKLCLCGPYPCHWSPSFSSISLVWCLRQAYLLWATFRVLIPRPHLCGGFNLDSLVARLLGASI